MRTRVEHSGACLAFRDLDYRDKIMLVATVVLLTGVGSSYLTTPHSILVKSGGLRFADTLLPIDSVGVAYLLTSFLLMFAFVRAKMSMYRYGLWLSLVTNFIWSALLGVASVSGAATYSAGLWPLYVATISYALSLALLKGEK